MYKKINVVIMVTFKYIFDVPFGYLTSLKMFLISNNRPYLKHCNIYLYILRLANILYIVTIRLSFQA